LTMPAAALVKALKARELPEVDVDALSEVENS
jgi:hypothetical protein